MIQEHRSLTQNEKRERLAVLKVRNFQHRVHTDKTKVLEGNVGESFCRTQAAFVGKRFISIGVLMNKICFNKILI